MTIGPWGTTAFIGGVRPAVHRRTARGVRVSRFSAENPPADDLPRAPRAPSVAPFFASTFAWNLALGMSHVLIPLYAYHLGYSGVAIGTLVSAPVIAQIVFNLVGGVWTDRIGGKRLALVSSVMLGAAGAVFAAASTYPALLFAQLCIIVSRSVYWPANWSLGSQLPGDRGAQLGRLNSTSSAGQIVGTVAAGLAIAHVGYRAGFVVLALGLAPLHAWAFRGGRRQ
jgi:MFS family permease